MKNDSAALPYQSAPQPASDEVPDPALGDARLLQVLRVEVRVRRRYAGDRDARPCAGPAAASGRSCCCPRSRCGRGTSASGLRIAGLGEQAAWPCPGRTGTDRSCLRADDHVGGSTWVSGGLSVLAAEHLDDVVAVDRVAERLPDLGVGQRLVVVRRGGVVDDVRVGATRCRRWSGSGPSSPAARGAATAAGRCRTPCRRSACRSAAAAGPSPG